MDWHKTHRMFGRPNMTTGDQRFENKLVRKKKARGFDVHRFLGSAGIARKVVDYRKSQKLYSQGDPASTVIYIQKGRVKLSVLNEHGKQAIVALLAPGDFLGEGCLMGVSHRMGLATAIAPTRVLVIRKKEMIRALHDEVKLSERFILHLLTRNGRTEEDLIDQLFNSIERRLARTLLSLARCG